MRGLLVGLTLVVATLSCTSASSDTKPIKIGSSMSLTGGVAVNGKQLLLALEIWRDDVNAKGGLLGRPVEFVYYDDQSNAAMVPGIYTKYVSDNSLEQFREVKHEVIIWPPEYRTGTMIYPYASAIK